MAECTSVWAAHAARGSRFSRSKCDIINEHAGLPVYINFKILLALIVDCDGGLLYAL